MTDPLRKPISGEPFVPSARQFGMFIDAANSIGQQRTERPRLGSEPDMGVVLVRNDTGSDIDEPHAVLAIDTIGDGVLIDPADRESVVHERPAFSGQTPDNLIEIKRFVILQQPLKDGAIGKAVVSGATWVKIRGAGLGFGDENLYASPVDGETDFLEAGAAGPAKVLWHDETSTNQTSGWAVVSLGVDSPPLIKVVIVDDPATFPNQLIAGSGTPVTTNLLVWDEMAGAWTIDPFAPPMQIYPDPGFRGVAFVGDQLDVYFSRESKRWQAVNGGHTIIEAFTAPTENPPAGVDFRAYAFLPDTPSPLDFMLIDIQGGIGPDGVLPLLANKSLSVGFTAVWVADRLVGPTSPTGGTWKAVYGWDVNCGLRFVDIFEGQSSGGIRLQLHGEQFVGDGLKWDKDACTLSANLDCAYMQETLPCCDSICTRLDNIEQRLDQIETIIDDLVQCCIDNTICCEYNTACCQYNTTCCEYNTACCEYNRQCCEYLDARVDYCCGDGSPTPGTPGGGPDCGRCVWEWNDPAEEPVLVEGCSGGATCNCNPPTVFDVAGIYFTDCSATTSGNISGCDCENLPEQLTVSLTFDTCSEQDDTFPLDYQGGTGDEVLYRGYTQEGLQVDLGCTVGGGWILSFACGPPYNIDFEMTNWTTEVCEPFELAGDAGTAWQVISCYSCITGGMTIQVTE